jgi:adenylate cyclase
MRLVEFVKRHGRMRQASLSLLVVAGFLLFFLISTYSSSGVFTPLERLSYDWQLRTTYRPLPKEIPIAIVDIDEASIQSGGRWPWPRKKMADLIDALYKSGAVVVALDMFFPEVEENLAEEVIERLKTVEEGGAQAAIARLEEVKPYFDYNTLLADSLKKGEGVVGFVCIEENKPVGEAPKPLLILSQAQENLSIVESKSYLGNIPVIAKAAAATGFINASPDPDGVLRFSPLLMREGKEVYGSLPLQAARLYLLTKKTELVTASYGGTQVLEGVRLDQRTIPTDSAGRILIPFRGPPYSFPYVSAQDILAGKHDPRALDGKLIFIGSTATAVGDVHATSMAPVFPGTEVGATIAQGIIDGYLPYDPAWARGAELMILVVLGIGASLLFPYFGPFGTCFLFIALEAAAIFTTRFVWTHYKLTLFDPLPILMVAALFILNLIYGFFAEKNRRKEMKSIFGQYVPETYLDQMLAKGGSFGLEGESKELTVLFADIFGFTRLSEKLSATEVKRGLNAYFNVLTEVIFKHHGTIDKYVGDMIIAFWGAPLEDRQHPYDAVVSALEMQERLAQVAPTFAGERVRFGIGINTGVMNVGDMGSQFRRAYTVLGDSVNLASRLESLTRMYDADVVVGEETWKKVQNDFIFKKLDKIRVKGKAQAVEIYQPLCLKGKESENLRAEVEKHQRAMSRYFSQDWEGAAKEFDEMALAWPRLAPLCMLFRARINAFQKMPPGKEWDGAYTLTEK